MWLTYIVCLKKIFLVWTKLRRSLLKIIIKQFKLLRPTLDRLLFGLGIRHVGAKAARLIAEKFQNIHQLSRASLEDLTEIDGVGPMIAESLLAYFDNKDSQVLLKELEDLGLNMTYQAPSLRQGPQTKDEDNFWSGKQLS